MADNALRSFYELMARQGGTAHVRQARALGVSRGRLESRHAELVVLQPGVVAHAGAPATTERAAWAAYLSVRLGGRMDDPRPVAVASLSAARAYGWPVAPGTPSTPHLVAPCAVRARGLVDTQLRRVGDWDHRRFATVSGRLTTAPIDTVLDLAGVLPRDDLYRYVQDELFRRASGRERLVARCREGVAGSTHVREVVAALDRGVDSVLHQNGHRHLAVVRLPEPDCGVELVPGLGEHDCVLRRPRATEAPWGMVVNWDGDIHRVSRRKYGHDRGVDRVLRRRGWASGRYGWEDHTEPADMYVDLTETWAHVMAGPRAWI